MPLPDQPTAYVVQHLKEALGADPRVGELGLDIEIRDERIFVRGPVRTPQQQAAVPAVISGLLPDCSVVNETHVEELGEPGDMESI